MQSFEAGASTPRIDKVQEHERIESPLSESEKAAFDVASIFAQGILIAQFVNARMPRADVARYKQLEGRGDSPETREEKAELRARLEPERERLSNLWMAYPVANPDAEPAFRFNKIVGDCTRIALGRSEGSPTPAEQSESIRFTRDMLELGRSQKKPTYAVTGYDVVLTEDEQALVARIQATLKHREQIPEGVEVHDEVPTENETVKQTSQLD